MSTISRAGQLLIGLWLFGAGIALLVRAGLGLASWDVLHQGLATRTGLSIGTVIVASGVLVLALWWPLRQRPGVGTVANVLLVGLAVDGTLAWLPTPNGLGWRLTFLVLGIVVNAIGTGLYIGAGLGPGPRDGLMTGLAARGLSIRRARTMIELAVLALGWLLGGTVGIGTVTYALVIGPLAHVFIPLFTVRSGQDAANRAITDQPAPSRAAPEHPEPKQKGT